MYNFARYIKRVFLLHITPVCVLTLTANCELVVAFLEMGTRMEYTFLIKNDNIFSFWRKVVSFVYLCISMFYVVLCLQ
jgi:hypothetical protein